jgi:hypothetical protein
MISVGQRPPEGGPRVPDSISFRYWSARQASVGGDFAANDVTEQLPLLALEPHHLWLGQRREIGG